MKHIFGTRNRQAGFTLVELLVGLTLSLVLISGLLAFIAPTVAALSNV